MEKTVKENFKKLLVWSIIVILVAMYMPIGEVYAYVNENNEISQQSIETQGKEANEVDARTEEKINEENNNTSSEETTEIKDIEDIQKEKLNVNNEENNNTINESNMLTIQENITQENVIQKDEIQEKENQNFESSSDLKEFIKEAQILDKQGNPVTTIDVGETYQIKLVFEEEPNVNGKQFGLDSNNHMTYQLPEAIKVLENTYHQEILTKDGIKVGEYSITTEGLVTIEWLKVDKDGNETENWYIDNYTNADLTLTFDSNFTSESFGQQVSIIFGEDVEINVTFIRQNSLVVNKSAEINSGSKYDIENHTIDYTVRITNYGNVSSLYIEDKMDPNLKLDSNEPITVRYEYLSETTKILEFNSSDSKYITKTDTGFILNLTPDGDTVPDQTQIEINYTVKLKDSALTGDGAVNLDAQNVVTATGTDTNNKKITDTDDETVSIHDIIISKSGEVVKAGEPARDVIKWNIKLGDGYGKINGIALTDTLGGDLSYAEDLPCIINLYDKSGNVTTLNIPIKTLMNENENEFYYTIPSDKDYYKAEIYYYTDFKSDAVINFFRNTVKADGPIGTVQTTGNVAIDTGKPEINKSATFDKNSDIINYSIEMSVPASYNNQILYLDDLTDINKKYNVNYGKFKEIFENSISMTATTESGEEITFVNAKNATTGQQHTYSIKYNNDGGIYILFNTSSDNVYKSIWNINEASLVNIQYKVPLASAFVIDENNPTADMGTLEQYLGQNVTNTVKVVTANKENSHIELVNDDFEIKLPINLEKTYETVEGTNIARFKININEASKDFVANTDVLTIVDTMSEELEYLPNTLKVVNVSTGEEITNYKSTYANNVLTIEDLPDATYLKITYDCIIIGTGTVAVSNLASITGVANTTSEIKENFEIQNSSAISGGDSSGLNFYILKYGENDLLSNVEFVLSDEEGNVIATPTTDENGKIELTGISHGKYYLRELYTPDSYIKLDGDITIEIDENNNLTVGYQGTTGKVEVKTEQNSNTKYIEIVNQKQEYINISGTKTWNDQENHYGTRPESITVNLLRNNELFKSQEVKPDTDKNWKYSFTNLPKYDEYGDEYSYRLTENFVPGYNVTIADDGTNITNTLDTTNFRGRKIWQNTIGDVSNVIPESITVHLLKNGQKTSISQTISQETGWTYEFNNLPKSDENGPITYSVEEDPIKGFTPTYTSILNGMDITNKIETTEVSGIKTWNDQENHYGTRPESITVNLLRNNEQYASQEVRPDASGNWTYTFTNLPKYDAQGEEFVYTIKENKVNGYESEVNGTNIINTLKTTSVSVTKNWNDQENHYGTRPESITVNLLRNNEPFTSQEVKPDVGGNWTYTFNNLPKYDTRGNEFVYTITESKVNGYESEVSGTNITNTLVTTSVSGRKTWSDFNNKYGLKPAKITVNVVKEGTTNVLQSQEVTAENGWTYTFNNLPKYDSNGQEIKYTVIENKVNGYEPEVSGMNITNTLKTTSVSVTKNWNDQENHYGTRPESITVNLLRNNEPFTSQEVKPNASGNWTYTFNNLPKYDTEGNEYVYTITENAVTGYDSEVSGTNIINTLKTTSVSGTKTWNDQDNKFDTRPESITVNLLRNNEPFTSQEVKPNASGNWTYTFNNLPKYDTEGNEYVYTITENAVTGYDSEVSGTNIINTLKTTSVSGKKTWIDNNNADGTRPTSITVNLLRNGTKVDSKVVTSQDGWMYTFTNLPEYNKDGSKSVYTVSEEELTGYTPKYDGMNIENTVKTINLSGTKTWNDQENHYGTRPESITINLFRNGKYVENKEVTAQNNWTYEFTNLPQYDALGNEFVYTIKEGKVNGYESEVSGMNVTNTLITTEISGTKTWNDNDNYWGLRPESITVNLVKEGTTNVLQSQEVTAENGWTYTFNNLPKYDLNGQEIKYTVIENEVNGYESEVSGMNVTNTLITTSVSGTKTWVDDDNASGLRPESVTINLIRNNMQIDSKVVTEETNWAYEFTNLPKYDAQGNEYVYTITENAVNGYEEKVDGTNVTNTLITTGVSGIKIWNDNNNSWGLRPESIIVNLLRNGKQVESKVVTEKNGWTYEFTNLPKYDAQSNEYVYTVTENPVNGYNAEISGTNIINTLSTTEVTVTKNWNDQDNKFNTRPDAITVNLFKNGEQITSQEIKPDASGNWTYTFTDLPKYDSEGKEYAYTVTENKITGYDTEISGTSITNTLITTDVSGVKTWNDNNNYWGLRPESITVNLLRNGEQFESKVVTEENNWTYEFTNLPKYDVQGNEYTYTVTENEVTGYDTEVLETNIINTLKTTEVTITKNWNDQNNKFNTRPDDIIVNLLKNGEQIISQEVKPDASGNWTYTFTDLPKYDSEGKEYAYTITENEVTGYDTEISGTDITNTLKTISVGGAKTWFDNNNAEGTRLESITVNLLRNGTKVDSKVVTAQDGWMYIFTNLPEYNKDGSKSVYTVSEEKLTGYTPRYDGMNIENSLKTINLSGTKTWNDQGNHYGTRPESITINLFRNGKYVENKEVTAQNNWTYEFTNLPQYDALGNEFVYTIKEGKVNGYESEVSGMNVTNTLITTSVSGTKTWNDNDNYWGLRPESITVNLVKEGTANVLQSQEVKPDTNGNWTYTFTDLPKYDSNGQEIRYTVIENPVNGYESEVSEMNVTNTLVTTNVTGTKTWNDFNNKNGLRPEGITVNVLRNGEEIESQTVTAKNNWTYTFTDLPKYDAQGNEYVYTVTENPVNGYESEVSEMNVTNTLITTNVTGTKTWNDFNNKYGTRPESITVNVLRNGEEIESQTVTAKNNWTYTFTDLPKYDAQGNEYVYTVTENPVNEYESEVSGMNVTNTLITTNVTGVKTWNDFNNKYGTRPESITVNVLRNGEEIESQTVTAKNNWTYTFTDLPKYDAQGNEYVYTVTENPINGYESEVSGMNVTNTLITTNVTGTKTWNDFNNKYETRPESITVNLLRNGKTFESVNVTETTGWTYEFMNLPKYDIEGNEYVYTLTENEVTGYKTSISGTNITNTLITTEVTGTKTWNDNNDVWQLRPDNINVNLFANGNKIDNKSVTGEGNSWAYEFTDIPKYDKDGKEIIYTVTEDAVDNYITTIDGYNIINKLIEPERPQVLNYYEEWPSETKMVTKKELLFNTPKTGSDNFLGYFIITAIISAMGIVIINKKNRDKE